MVPLCVADELAHFGPAARPARRMSRDEAVNYCRRLALAHYENFSVAGWLLPKELRPHVYAIYAYCRWADDLADEAAAGDRSSLLDWWASELAACYAGSAEHPVFVALRSTIEEFGIPPEPFRRLLEAFRRDQRVARYATPEDVLAYCARSANPVGRLVLYLGRCHDERRGRLSDTICTGLQLANFCQDVARDHALGRVYLPRTTLDQAGYSDAMLAEHRFNDAFRRAMRVEVERAERHLRDGEPLVALMPRALQVQTALFIGGGLEILRAIRGIDYDVWGRRPTISKFARLGIFARAWWRTRLIRKWGAAR